MKSLLDSILVVGDLLNLFIINLPGLPIEHDIEFVIDLYLGT